MSGLKVSAQLPKLTGVWRGPVKSGELLRNFWSKLEICSQRGSLEVAGELSCKFFHVL